MKRFIGFLPLLCLFIGVAEGQVTTNKLPGKGLVVGDKVPASVGLDRYKGKLLIIDFWATWCAPCRKMMPLADSLQKVFAKEVVFLPVTYERGAVVAPVLAAMRKRQPFTLEGITGDTVLNRLFPHRALPHYVWIDASGTVRAVTEDSEITAEHIRKALANWTGGSATSFTMVQKRDTTVRYVIDKPLFMDGHGGNGSATLFRSVLSGYVPGLQAGMTITPFDPVAGQRFNVRNVPLTWLCRLAFGEGGRWFQDSRIAILSRDSALMTSKLSGQIYNAWLAAGHGWCYELALPPLLKEQAFAIMQADLHRLFPLYAVTVEQRQRRCLVLVRTSSADKLKSAGGPVLADIGPFGAKLRNSALSQLLQRLDHQYLQNSPLPVIDGSGYTGRVDLDLSAALTDVSSLNEALKRYDLAFVEQNRPVEMLVIRDAPVVAN